MQTKTKIISFAALATLIAATTAQSADQEALINWKNVNPGCTVKCVAYWACYAKNWEDPSKCQPVAGCECNKFADDDLVEEEKINWGKIDNIAGKIGKGLDTYNQIRGIWGEEDEFKLGKALKKVGGVAKTAFKVYKTANGAGLLDDDLVEEEKINWGKIDNFAGKVGKVLDTYGKIRGIFGEEEEEDLVEEEKINWGKVVGGVGKALDTYGKIRGLFGEEEDLVEEEKINWGKIDNFAGKVGKVIDTYGKIRGIFGEEEDLVEEEKINWGKVVGGVGKALDTYGKIRGLFGEEEEDEINWGNVNLGCTLKCAAYWGCYAKNWETPNQCQPVAGCECNKFADDDMGLFSKVGKFLGKADKVAGKIGKGLDTYNKVRGLFGEEEEDEFKLGKALKKVGGVAKTAFKVYKTANGAGLLDDDLVEEEKINWGKIDNIAGKIGKGIDTYNQIRGIWSEEDAFKLGKALKKVGSIAKFAGKAVKTAGAVGLLDDDEKKFNFDKFIGGVDKAIDVYGKIRGAFSEEEDEGLGKIFKGAKKVFDVAKKVKSAAGVAGAFIEEEEDQVNLNEIINNAQKAIDIYRTLRRD